MHGKRRFFWLLTTTLLTASAACTLLLDRDSVQCSSNGDCAKFAATATCVNSVCVLPDGGNVATDSGNDANNSQAETGPIDNDAGVKDATVGFDGCFPGTPTTPEQFLNACTAAACVPFDDCSHLGICDGGYLGTLAPPPPVPAAPSADSGALDTCLNVAAAQQGTGSPKTVVVTGSSNFPPFLTTFAPVLAKDGYNVIWQTTNSCTGVDVIYNQFSPSPNPTKQAIRETKNHGSTLFYKNDGTTIPCFLDGDTAPDVGESDVYGSSCTGNIGYDPTASVAGGVIGEYLGPILPMVFIVPSSSSQDALSAAAGQAVFGRGAVPDAGALTLPYNDPTQLFVRASSTATNQMMSRAINVDPTKWWGVDKGTATTMASQMKAVPSQLGEKTIGIISADFADNERPGGSVGDFHALSFQAQGQKCGFLPDSTEFKFDKKNVRDGHYAMWGPIHFFTRLSGGTPASAAAQAFLVRISAQRLDQDLLESIVKSHLIPACAMRVTRDVEMGPIRARKQNERPVVCDCLFDKVSSNLPDGGKPVDLDGNTCTSCSGAGDCPAGRPACNYGFCEPL